MSGGHKPARMWPGVALATFLATLAFIISFDALRTLGLACGINNALAWMFPLIIDGSTLAFTWAAWAFKTRALSTWYPWAALVLFSIFSLIGNALHAHAVRVGAMMLPSWAPSIIMTVPPIALLATTHMIVLAASRTYDEIAASEPVAEPAQAAPEPVIEPEMAPAQAEEETAPAREPMPEPDDDLRALDEALSAIDKQEPVASEAHEEEPEPESPAPDVREEWRRRLSGDGGEQLIDLLLDNPQSLLNKS